MKKPGFIAAAFLATFLVAVPLASGQGQKTGKARAGSAEEQIKALTAEDIQARLKADTEFLEKYYADDALIIHSPGTVYTKAQEIADFKSGALKGNSVVVRDQKIRIYGNTAVVNTLLTAGGLINSKPFNADLRVTYVWVKLSGNWKLASRQITKVLPSQ